MMQRLLENDSTINREFIYAKQVTNIDQVFQKVPKWPFIKILLKDK